MIKLLEKISSQLTIKHKVGLPIRKKLMRLTSQVETDLAVVAALYKIVRRREVVVLRTRNELEGSSSSQLTIKHKGGLPIREKLMWRTGQAETDIVAALNKIMRRREVVVLRTRNKLLGRTSRQLKIKHKVGLLIREKLIWLTGQAETELVWLVDATPIMPGRMWRMKRELAKFVSKKREKRKKKDPKNTQGDSTGKRHDDRTGRKFRKKLADMKQQSAQEMGLQSGEFLFAKPPPPALVVKKPKTSIEAQIDNQVMGKTDKDQLRENVNPATSIEAIIQTNDANMNDDPSKRKQRGEEMNKRQEQKDQAPSGTLVNGRFYVPESAESSSTVRKGKAAKDPAAKPLA